MAAKVREKRQLKRGSPLGRWVSNPSLVTAEPGLPATYYLPGPCVTGVLWLQGILSPMTREAVGLRTQFPEEVSGRGVAK
ncbi:hypothetical protein MRX96_008924 [Rhipicephalus microplus]